MNCEEFADAGLDSDIDAAVPDAAAAREHLRNCPGCAALYESSIALRANLRELGQTTSDAATPSRVEMRLRQEFRTLHKTNKNRSRAVVAAWVLAAAALALVASSLAFWRWEKGFDLPVAHTEAPSVIHAVATGPELGGTLIAENEDNEFALIPGAMPGLLGETTVVRVQMQRGSLGALGLSVNEEHAADVVQVDLLLGDDGQPQAYRLPKSND